jgi:hypothetical protein
MTELLIALAMWGALSLAFAGGWALRGALGRGF